MANQTAAETASLTRTALVDSVRAHLVSDVPTGIFLSGGIDSTALVALVREAGLAGAVDTFSIGVDDADLDESRLASRTAKHFQTNHQVTQLNAQTCESIFYDFIKSVDQPSIDGINTYTISSLARKEGMKVVLSGLGGDELFGGYPSFTKVPQLRRWAAGLGFIPGLAGLTGSLLERYSSSHRLRRVGSMLKRPTNMVSAFRAFRGVFSTSEAQRLAKHFSGAEMKGKCVTINELSGAGLMNDLDAVSECELTMYMRNQLLRDSDVMSMAHGLELRLPYVDKILFENVAQLPAAKRLRQGKQLLLEAVPEIPHWIRGRPKRGFMFPYETWLAAKWGDMMSSVDRWIPCANPTWYQRWAVFMLQNWMNEGE
jgi:asparagine synthase (glutamine-hydrolysing)